jgi:hypothetical protein
VPNSTGFILGPPSRLYKLDSTPNQTVIIENLPPPVIPEQKACDQQHL